MEWRITAREDKFPLLLIGLIDSYFWKVNELMVNEVLLNSYGGVKPERQVVNEV